MTCIVAIGDGDRVWMGGDSAGVAGLDVVDRADEKVFVKGPMVFGFCGSFRAGQLLRYSLRIPPHTKGDVMEYLVNDFITSVHRCFKDGGAVNFSHGSEWGHQFLIGYRGNVYDIEVDYQVGIPRENMASVGCGQPYAMGSLQATKRLNPKDRIKAALEAAALYSGGVQPPFTIVVGGKRND